MSKPRVTMADIARVDGTHVTTVSLALRNSPRLPESTRRRIQALAEKMGYRPDPMMRALVAYRESRREPNERRTLAYVTNWTTRWGWREVTAHPQFYKGAEAAADQLGFRLEHFWLREPGLSHGRLSGILDSRGIEGLIIASHSRDMDENLRFDWDHFASVKIDYFPHYPRINNVTNDQCGMIRLAMRRIRDAGYQRIGLVMHRGWDKSVDRMWSAGFFVEQSEIPEEARIPPCYFPELHPLEAWTNEGNQTEAIASERLGEWYEHYRPEVIISKYSFVQPAFASLGLRIPDDVSFVDLFLDQFDGTVAGIKQDPEGVGATAVSMLAARLSQNKRGMPHKPTTTFVEGSWVDGATLPRKSDPLPRDSQAVRRRPGRRVVESARS